MDLFIDKMGYGKEIICYNSRTGDKLLKLFIFVI